MSERASFVHVIYLWNDLFCFDVELFTWRNETRLFKGAKAPKSFQRATMDNPFHWILLIMHWTFFHYYFFLLASNKNHFYIRSFCFSRFSAVSWILVLSLEKKAFSEIKNRIHPFSHLKQNRFASSFVQHRLSLIFYDTSNMCSFHFDNSSLMFLLFHLLRLLTGLAIERQLFHFFPSFHLRPLKVFFPFFSSFLKRHVLILLDVHFFVKIIVILSTREIEVERKTLKSVNSWFIEK